MKQKHLMDYQEIVKHEDGSERLIEAGPAAASKGVIEEYHRAFAGSELVAKHFERAEETWAAAFTPNDGGVGFLVERLSEVLDPNLKKQQIGSDCASRQASSISSLRRFYHADDDASRREKAALMELRRSSSKRCALATSAPSRTCSSVCWCASARCASCSQCPALRLADAPRRRATPTVIDAWSDDPWAATPLEVEKRPPMQTVDRAAMFATNVVNHWTESLRGLSRNADAMQALGVEGRIVDDVVQR